MERILMSEKDLKRLEVLEWGAKALLPALGEI
jgi:hypothetical protein